MSFAVAMLLLFTLSSCSNSTTPATGTASTDTIYSASSTHYGLTYAQWSAKWWQWAFQQPVHNSGGAVIHPLRDWTGANAGNGQDPSSPIYFLGGFLDTSGKATRNVTISSSKSVFFPILNTEIDTTGGWNADSVAKYVAITQSLPVTLSAVIDGQSVQNLSSYLTTSDLFNLTLTADNPYQLQGYIFPAGHQINGVASVGYWLMLAPLSKGSHTIHFTGIVNGSGTTQDITYNITSN